MPPVPFRRGLVLLVLLAAVSGRAGVVLTTETRGARGAPGVVTSFATTIRNTGAAADTFVVELNRAMPDGWTVSLCEGTTCYPPVVTMITVALAPGADTVLEVDVVPDAIPDVGVATVAVNGTADPAATAVLDFSVLTPGLDVLVVADGPSAGQEACAAAVAATGRAAGTWRRDRAGAPDGDVLGAQPVVVWTAGPTTDGLPGADLGNLAYFVQHGGGLLLTGRHLVAAACDPARPTYAPTTVSWYEVVMGLAWAGAETAASVVTGVAGDPLGGVLPAAALTSACREPDALRPGTGAACLKYDGGAVAGVRHRYGSGAAVGLGFGSEDLADPPRRDALFAAALGWLAAPAAALPVRTPLALQVGPNPGNPAFVIRWEQIRAGPLSVTIHDIAGRLVAVLHEGPAPAAGTAIWHGTDRRGQTVGTGVYLCRVTGPVGTAMRKLTLVR